MSTPFGKRCSRALIATLLIVCSLTSLVACSFLPRQNRQPAGNASATDKPSPITLPSSTPPSDNQQPQPPAKITIRLTGDVMMDSFIGQYIRDYGVDYPWTDVAPLLSTADLAMVNLETSVSERGWTKKPEGYGFRSLPYTVQGLVHSGIDAVDVANNHVLDFGLDAFDDTLQTLKQNNIVWVGAGQNRQEAEQLKIIEKNGVKVGLLAYTEIIPYPEWVAGPGRPGVAPLTTNDHQDLLRAISAADKQCDILLVSLHWGTEYAQQPYDWQVKLAHQIIDSGADAIIGGHPHVLQGVELYQDKPILYSLGNFVFLKMNELAGKSGVFELTFDKNGFDTGRLYPVWTNYCKANLYQPADPVGQEIIGILRDVSRPFGTVVSDQGAFSSKNR